MINGLMSFFRSKED